MKQFAWTVPPWLHNPVWQITALGTLTWLAYLHLVQSYPLVAWVAKYPLTDFGRANEWSRLALVDFLISIFGALALYLLALQVTRRHAGDRRLLWIVITFAVLFAISLLAMYPITATDIFEYVFHSRILTHYGQNPLATPPIAFRGDPFLKTVNWAVQPSPYGPLWVILTVPGSLLAGNDLIANLFLMKALPVVFYIGCVLVIAAILCHKEPHHKLAGTLLFAWNPLILFEAPGNGHNGIIMMFFALVAIYALVRRRWLWVMPLLVASVLVKYITALLLLPFLIYCLRAHTGTSQRLAFLARTLMLSGLLVAAIALPFMAVPSGLLDEANFFSLLAIPTLAFHFLKTIHGDKLARTLITGTSSAIYCVVYAASLRYLGQIQRPRRLILLSTWLIVAYLVVASTHFQPWFVIWPIALGIWIDHSLTRRVLVIATASTLLSYAANFFWVWNIRTWQSHQVNLMFVAVIFVPPLVVGILSYIRDTRFALPKESPALTIERAV